jgi:hypothetical protein
MRIDINEAQRRLSSQRNLANLRDSVTRVDPQFSSTPLEPTSSSSSPVDPQSQEDVEVGHFSGVTHAEVARRNTGRTTGSRNLTEEQRDLIANTPGSTRELGIAFGIAQQTVSQIKSGRVGGHPPNRAREEKVKERRLDAEDVALQKLMKSLNLLDEEKMADASAKDLSIISRNMAAVSSSLRDKNAGPEGNNINITVYAPEQKREDKYKVVDV